METTAAEVKRLQSCINDLISVLALPAIWSGNEPSQIVGTLLDVLLAMLRLDLAYSRLSDPSDGPPIEVVRLSQRQNPSALPQEVSRALDRWLSDGQTTSRVVIPSHAGEAEVAIASFSLGLQDEVGVLVAGSRRTDFPTDIELLLLRVAANQAAIGLQEARRSGDQKRVAEALERRVAERTSQLTDLNEELQQQANLLDQAHDAIFVWEFSRTIVYWNRGAEHLYGFSRAEAIGRLGHDLLNTEHPMSTTEFEAALERDGEWTGELTQTTRDGRKIIVESRQVMMRDKDGRRLVLETNRDITDRKQAEAEQKRAAEALRQAQADLAHVSRSTTMGELTASLAHEVNQPITASVTNANTCVRWLAGETPNIEEAREAAIRSAKDGTRAAEIISRIRLLFKKGATEREVVDVNEVIREMIVLLRGEATRYAVSIRTDLAADLPQLMADRVQLQQVMLNLIMNSIDAMKDADGTRELAIKSQQTEDEQLLVSVSDTGVGLPVQANEIFNAFFTTKLQGTGLGLSISRSIIESHGGRLWATENSPRGASFYFTLSTKVDPE
jgi:PAS domain S-box-containing protein